MRRCKTDFAWFASACGGARRSAALSESWKDYTIFVYRQKAPTVANLAITAACEEDDEDMPKHIAFVEISSTGAGHTSLEYCRAQGYWVTLLCQHPEKLPPELTRDIHVVQTDTTDHAILLATALEVHTRRAINGITTSNDFFVPEAALLAAELGLPGMGYLAALSARNKYLTRLQLRTNGLDTLNPRFFLARSREYAHSCAEELRYPFIAKLQNIGRVTNCC